VLRDDPFEPLSAGQRVKLRTPAALMIAVLQRLCDAGQHFAKALLPFDQRPGTDRLTIEVEEIEQKENERLGILLLARRLHDAEGGRAIGSHAAQLGVEIGGFDVQMGERLSDGRIFFGPVETGSRQQPYPPPLDPGVHAIAVELDFMQPVRAVRRFGHELRQLRLYPIRERHTSHCHVRHIRIGRSYRCGAYASSDGDRPLLWHFAVWRDAIDQAGQVLAELRQEILRPHARVARHVLHLVIAENRMQLLRGDRLVGTITDPGLGDMTQASLLEGRE
jgi:hypothetical protein